MNPQQEEGHVWTIQFERNGVYKTPEMGWQIVYNLRTFTNDMQSRFNLQFPTLEEAIKYCQQYGLGYEISYPKKRWHTPKNYANNFKWKGNPKQEDDDLA